MSGLLEADEETSLPDHARPIVGLEQARHDDPHAVSLA